MSEDVTDFRNIEYIAAISFQGLVDLVWAVSAVKRIKAVNRFIIVADAIVIRVCDMREGADILLNLVVESVKIAVMLAVQHQVRGIDLAHWVGVGKVFGPVVQAVIVRVLVVCPGQNSEVLLIPEVALRRAVGFVCVHLVDRLLRRRH